MTSNFIVDMKIKTFHRIVMLYFILFFGVLAITSLRYYYDEYAIYDIAYSLSYFGYGGLILFLISCLKKDSDLSGKKVPLIMFSVFFILTALSVVFSVDMFTAIYGNKGRYEGFLSILGYSGLFLTASILGSSRMKKIFSDVFVGFGTAYAILGILQSISALEKYIPSYYKIIRQRVEGYLANGLTGSPVFLGALLTMLVAVSLSGLMYDDKRARKVLYGISAVISIVCAFLTDVIQPLIGISAAFITIGIIEVIKRKKFPEEKKKGILKSSLGSYSLIFTIGAIVTAAMLLTGEAKLQDKSVIYEDSFYRAYVTGDQNAKDNGNIYLHMQSEGLDIIKDNPIFGAGPDCITRKLYMTPSSSDTSVEGNPDAEIILLLPAGSIDRPYNEYLYIAMSRGIPCLLAYLAFLFFTLKKGFSKVGGFFKKNEEWTAVAFTVAVVAYLVQAFVSMSDVSVAPFFWIMLGFILTKKKAEE